MQLNHQERQDLAQFFDRRFPDGGARLSLARRAGLPCEDTGNGEAPPWVDLVELAAARGNLGRLTTVARAAAPDDTNLRSLAELMAPRRSPLVWVALPAAGLLVAAAVVLVAVLWGTGPAEQDGVAPDLVSVVASGAPASDIGSGPSRAQELDAGSAAPGGPAAVAAAPEAAPAADAAPLPSAPQRAAIAKGAGSAAASSVGAGRCTAAQGELIGWWYAGNRNPVQVGATYTLPTHANVRADFPDEHNRFNARTALRCTLFPGDRIQVSHAAKQVPGNAYWVPLYGGDLLADPL